MSMSRLTVFCLGLALTAVALPVHAQGGLAPTPRKAPRTPVKSTTLVNKDARPIPVSQLLSGRAMILDTERLQLQGIELRLFGISPPAINAPFGPQARSVLDSLARSTVTCKIKDRERSGTYLASCTNEEGVDFGIELLRRGLAVTDRSALEPTTLVTPYLASERAAQSQKLGLWETKVPSAATTQSIRQAGEEAKAAKNELARLLAEKKNAEEQVERLKMEAVEAAEADTEEQKQEDAIETTELINETTLKTAPLPQIKPDESALSEETIVSPQKVLTSSVVAALLPAETTLPENDILLEPTASASSPELKIVSWFERYQFFVTGLLFLFSALIYVCGNVLWKTRERKEDLRSMAVALRGELMAARAIARARLSKWSEDTQESKTAAWPRIRVMVFQAYLAKLGNLGAELSRQIATIYGQTSDFASYYSQNDKQGEFNAKKHALQTLLDHIEEVLPRLTKIEEKGSVPKPLAQASIRSSLLSRMPLQKKLVSLPTDGGTPTAISAPEKEVEKESVSKKSPSLSLADSKAEIMNERPHKKSTKKEGHTKQKKDLLKDAATSFLDLVNVALENATQRLAELRAKPTEEFIPDYANLTEEEIEALAEDYFNEAPLNKKTNRAK